LPQLRPKGGIPREGNPPSVFGYSEFSPFFSPVCSISLIRLSYETVTAPLHLIPLPGPKVCSRTGTRPFFSDSYLQLSSDANLFGQHSSLLFIDHPLLVFFPFFSHGREPTPPLSFFLVSGLGYMLAAIFFPSLPLTLPC